MDEYQHLRESADEAAAEAITYEPTYVGFYAYPAAGW